MNNYPLIDNGTHIIIDIYEIENNEILKFNSTIIPILDAIVDKYNLNVVNKSFHQFIPFGFTGVYILAESHLSIHTFVDEKKAALDLYTCKTFTETTSIINFIHSFFPNSKIKFKVIER